MKLYRAWSILKKFEGFEDVRITWYCPRREKPVLPYTELIIDYEPEDEDSVYSEGYVNELFSLNELEKLKQYLAHFSDFKESDGKILFFTEKSIPCPSNSYPYGGIPSDREHGSIRLKEERGDGLSIPINGYYDLRPFFDKERDSFPTYTISTDSDDKEYVDDLPF